MILILVKYDLVNRTWLNVLKIPPAEYTSIGGDFYAEASQTRMLGNNFYEYVYLFAVSDVRGFLPLVG